MTSDPASVRCWNCQETVHPYAVNCPYCASDLGQDKLDREATTPPFAFQRPEETPAPVAAAVAEAPASTSLTPLWLLLPGTVFFLFALVLLLYSKNGVFTLHWNGSLWPFYMAVSSVMLFLGWRSLREQE